MWVCDTGRGRGEAQDGRETDVRRWVGGAGGWVVQVGGCPRGEAMEMSGGGWVVQVSGWCRWVGDAGRWVFTRGSNGCTSRPEEKREPGRASRAGTNLPSSWITWSGVAVRTNPSLSWSVTCHNRATCHLRVGPLAILGRRAVRQAEGAVRQAEGADHVRDLSRGGMLVDNDTRDHGLPVHNAQHEITSRE